jgi:transcription termination factor Rho
MNYGNPNVVLSELGMINLADQQVVMSRNVFEDLTPVQFAASLKLWSDKIYQVSALRAFSRLSKTVGRPQARDKRVPRPT